MLSFLSFFILLINTSIFLLYSSLVFSNTGEHSTGNEKGYTCQVNESCLNYLTNTLLSKDSDKGVYQHCKGVLDKTKFCCVDPSQCKESWGKSLAQDLRETSLQRIQTSSKSKGGKANKGGGGEEALSTCELKKLSPLMKSLSKIQYEVCNVGLKNCKLQCENKLKEVTKTFRQCFFIPPTYSIERILEKTKNHPIVENTCYQKMYNVVEKYKVQSRGAKSFFREKLASKDIVECYKELKSVNTEASLNHFTLSMCYQAKTQKEERQKRAKKKAKTAKREKGAQEVKQTEQAETHQSSLTEETHNSSSPLEGDHLNPNSKNNNVHSRRTKTSNDRSSSSGHRYEGGFHQQAPPGYAKQENSLPPLPSHPLHLNKGSNPTEIPQKNFFQKSFDNIKTLQKIWFQK